ncbi:MAG TPA: YdbL family protein [Steroidobacteraceae bacterium]
MFRWITALLASFVFGLAACVTINVYFPAAAAEKAADRIIEDIWGPDKAGKPAGNEQSSAGSPAGEIMVAALQGALDFVIPAAQAQADIDISSPAIRALTASMKTRNADLEPFFSSGAIGLTSDGLIEVRDNNAVPLADRTRLRTLVSADNTDRNSLYREIAGANGHPEWETDIRNTFAERWIANARAGWYYKSKAGAWTRK